MYTPAHNRDCILQSLSARSRCNPFLTRVTGAPADTLVAAAAPPPRAPAPRPASRNTPIKRNTKIDESTSGILSTDEIPLFIWTRTCIIYTLRHSVTPSQSASGGAPPFAYFQLVAARSELTKRDIAITRATAAVTVAAQLETGAGMGAAAGGRGARAARLLRANFDNYLVWTPRP
ncbi:hypothetical protein EVAR_97486_1 [Eumeta japonica]|uniref:Uncharacterized protein n=1 Tax=Eumeta variegata TaxID=151549 RepID=A0A4C1Z8M8_EUMVA|nr:hypothetical protein EVAR_97486_1 [Eumeta japonica]